jgi:hypothetical protein
MEVLIAPVQDEGMKPSLLLPSVLALEIALAAQPTIRIRLFDYAKLPAGDLKSFENVASRILRWGGVASVWLDCPISGTPDPATGCSGFFAGTDFAVRLLPSSKIGEVHAMGTSLASAAGGLYATMYFPTVKRAAQATAVPVPTMLALATVHELGHLILGVDSHSHEGIMHPQWTAKEIGEMTSRSRLFNAAESRQMREKLMARAGSGECGGRHRVPGLDCRPESRPAGWH